MYDVAMNTPNTGSPWAPGKSQINDQILVIPIYNTRAVQKWSDRFTIVKMVFDIHVH